MTKWSKAQDELLREFGNRGAEYCAAALRNRFGISRTPEAVRRHAYRVGISIIRYETCPRCGRAVSTVGADGLCGLCHQRRLAEEQKAFNASILAELRNQDREREIAEVRKDYQNARQQTSRICRKYGIRNRKERRYGDFEKCHTETSHARSDA